MEKEEMKNTKPRIALMIDKEGWALDNSAKQIKKYLSDYYDIDIIPMDIFGDNAIKILILANLYDLMSLMWRGNISWLNSDFSKEYISNLGFEYEEFIEKYLRGQNIVTAVYDHLFLEEQKERTEFIFNNVKDYIVSSEKLKTIYDEYPNIKKPSMVIADGVDLDLFKPKGSKENDSNKTLIIGWTGNSKFTDATDDDLKGVTKIIMPAIKELKEEGYDITLNVADRNVKMIAHEDMPEYYNYIDIYVCGASTEGKQNSVI